jgi:cysteine desulfurase/selenocysteine lyase
MVSVARSAAAQFINASVDSIIFTSGTTDGMNRVADMLAPASVVAVSDLDHHSARLPFAEKHETIIIPLDSEFNIDVIGIEKSDAIVITAMSNVLGMPQDVKKIIAAARAKNPNVIAIVDAAQYAAHLPIDVKDWDCDALMFSGHKIGADTGLGIMYLKNPDMWRTTKFGGGMFMATGPARFEAGTLPLTQIAGLVPAIKELRDGGPIIKYLHGELSKLERVKIITKPNAALLSFTVDGMHALDFGAMMGAHGICLRVGNMCASWLHELMGLPGTIRISAGFWNTMDEAIQVTEAIKKITK